MRSYVTTASHAGLTSTELGMRLTPWLGEPHYPSVRMPTHVFWGEQDTWIPVDRAHRLAERIPDAGFTTIPDAGHLVQLDTPVALATALTRWLSTVTS